MIEEASMTTTTEPQDPFLFKPASWQSKIDFIQHLIQFNNVLTVVLAERQGGKSSFAQLMQQSLDGSSQSCIIDINEGALPDVLNNRIAEKLDITESGSIASLMQQVNENRKPVFLLLDNAESISEPWLSALLNAIHSYGESNYFHVCLLSDFTVVPLLNRCIGDKFQNIVHSIELGGLKENECRTYILHRARQLGLTNDYINDSVFKRIYKATAGDVAQINQNINQLLAQGARKKSSFSSAKIAAVTASLAFFALGIAYLMQPSLVEIDAPEKEKKYSAAEFVENEDIKPQALEPKAELIEEPRPSYIADYRLAAEIQKTVLPSHIHPLNMAEARYKNPSNIPSLKEMAMISSLKHSESKPEIAAASRSPEPSKAVKEDVLHYTIQLLASVSKQDLEQFADKAGISHRATIKKIQKEDADWYILTVGDFNSFSQAKKELSQLPGQIIAHKPWIRPVKTA